MKATSCETNRELIRGIANLRPEHRGNVVTIGAFDGVHLGHQAIMKQVVDKARELGVPSMVITFEPLPREYLQEKVARIQSFREKVLALFAQGIDRVLCLPFNKELTCIPPEDFIHKLLLDALGTRYLVVGDDFRFGNQRKGNTDMLRAAGASHGFEVSKAHTVEVDGARVSSTRIRQALERGELEEAGRLLGRPFTFTGRVRPGKQLGRTLGIPTANIALKRRNSPLEGVYAVTVSGAGLKEHPGVANIGLRPTVNALGEPLLEVHLLDWSGSLYGQRLTVEPKLKLRDEERFENVAALQQQMEQDIEKARKFLKRDG